MSARDVFLLGSIVVALGCLVAGPIGCSNVHGQETCSSDADCAATDRCVNGLCIARSTGSSSGSSTTTSGAGSTSGGGSSGSTGASGSTGSTGSVSCALETDAGPVQVSSSGSATAVWAWDLSALAPGIKLHALAAGGGQVALGGALNTSGASSPVVAVLSARGDVEFLGSLAPSWMPDAGVPGGAINSVAISGNDLGVGGWIEDPSGLSHRAFVSQYSLDQCDVAPIAGEMGDLCRLASASTEIIAIAPFGGLDGYYGIGNSGNDGGPTSAVRWGGISGQFPNGGYCPVSAQSGVQYHGASAALASPSDFVGYVGRSDSTFSHLQLEFAGAVAPVTLEPSLAGPGTAYGVAVDSAYRAWVVGVVDLGDAGAMPFYSAYEYASLPDGGNVEWPSYTWSEPLDVVSLSERDAFYSVASNGQTIAIAGNVDEGQLDTRLHVEWRHLDGGVFSTFETPIDVMTPFSGQLAIEDGGLTFVAAGHHVLALHP